MSAGSGVRCAVCGVLLGAFECFGVLWGALGALGVVR